MWRCVALLTLTNETKRVRVRVRARPAVTQEDKDVSELEQRD